MKKLIVLFLIVFFGTTTAFAQQSSFCRNLKYGVEVGTNLSSVVFSGRIVDWELIDPQPKLKLGYRIGGFINYNFKKYFILETGISFSSKGYELPLRTKSINGNPIVKYRQRASSNYFEIPFVFGIQYPISELDIHLKFGPYIAYGVYGKVEIDKATGLVSSNMFGSENLYPFKRFDYGGKIILGVDFWEVSFDLFYDFGLNNIANFEDSKLSPSALSGGTFENDKVFNYSMGITARYKF